MECEVHSHRGVKVRVRLYKTVHCMKCNKLISWKEAVV